MGLVVIDYEVHLSFNMATWVWELYQVTSCKVTLNIGHYQKITNNYTIP